MATVENYEILVVGAGHAGVEAALIAARCHHRTALVTLNRSSIAKMPCNPSVGGPAKGIVVREIDALGGQMGITADQTALQFKMLNTAKGPGVQSLRVQSDKLAYSQKMREIIEQQEDLTLLEKQVIQLNTEQGRATGVTCADGTVLQASIVILTTGTYLSSTVMVSAEVTSSGPDQEPTTNLLSESLRAKGIRTFRLKTGTPARVLTSSIDFSAAEPQPGSDFFVCFSSLTKSILPPEQQALCYLTYTTPQTHQIIRENLNRSSMYSGVVKGVGPRYCPSIEDKLVRFADKERHQIFLEPESRSLDTTYIQGFSTSMPYDVQEKMIHSLPGLSQAVIKKYAYAIEYDAVDPLQLKPSLESKVIENLFTAGQINGTSGYEEAAGQGLMAGINAVLKLEKKEPLILRRDEAYIGVMIDDLVTKGTQEPYRLLTSRAEFRLLLRHDNADQRLTLKAEALGLIHDQRAALLRKKLAAMEQAKNQLKATRFTKKSQISEALKELEYSPLEEAISAYDLLRRPHISWAWMQPYVDFSIDPSIGRQIEIECKYEGYIEKAKKEAAKLQHMEQNRIPADLDYQKIQHLSLEGRQKLMAIRPETLGQASRISGVNPADIAVLAMALEQLKREEKKNEDQ